MKETVREARTTIKDKNGKTLPVPEGTDPHLAAKPLVGGRKSEVRGQMSEAGGQGDRKPEKEEVKDA
jgi:hypothetical protein